MDKHARSFKPSRLAVAILLAITPLAVTAGERGAANPLTDEDLRWIERGEEIIEQSQEIVGQESLFPDNYERAEDDAQQFFSDLRRTNPTLKAMDAQQPPEGKRYANYSTLIFASFSLEREGLEDILELASMDEQLVVAFRGIPDDMEVAEGVRFLQELALQYDPIPNIVLDPTLFQEHGVTSVPTIVRLEQRTTVEGGDREVVARVTGLSDPAWLERQIELGENGDLGVRGPVAEIAERDLVEVMQERVMAIDWDLKREQALERFWSNQNFEWLPPATRSRTRRLDPRVHVLEDIVGPNGEVIAEQGQIINPLDSVPFTQAIVVMNATDPREIELVQEALHGISSQPGVARVTFIATELDADEGWDSYTAVSDAFDAPIYLLTPDVKERFALEFTPSVITSDGEDFIVRELTWEDV
ncbi:TrbC family F-type conjugative pilus assembly protein [Halomonas sp. C05BenzN]|uniref:TrbC family F-type conjugative pilus assembly protein n=1 Tax=Halomonas sp. C05BenzN TaxID=3411041 RepID=UPI003B92DB9A